MGLNNFYNNLKYGLYNYLTRHNPTVGKLEKYFLRLRVRYRPGALNLSSLGKLCSSIKDLKTIVSSHVKGTVSQDFLTPNFLQR